jgi:transcriptional regulator with XRE-family HTH domain
MSDVNKDGDQLPLHIESNFSDAQSTPGTFTDSKASEDQNDKTIRLALADYEIGRKLRQLRLKKKIALADLGKHTGLSASLLSQLENGKLIPTLPTLARIALVFDIGVDYFFVDKKDRYIFSIVRAGDRLRFPDIPNAERPNFFFECLAYSIQEKSLQAYMAEFPCRDEEEVRPHNHGGAEFLHLIEGRLAIRYHNEVHTLETGDSAYFDGSEPHSYWGLSESPLARALVITTVPRA